MRKEGVKEREEMRKKREQVKKERVNFGDGV